MEFPSLFPLMIILWTTRRVVEWSLMEKLLKQRPVVQFGSAALLTAGGLILAITGIRVVDWLTQLLEIHFADRWGFLHHSAGEMARVSDVCRHLPTPK